MNYGNYMANMASLSISSSCFCCTPSPCALDIRQSDKQFYCSSSVFEEEPVFMSLI